MNAVVETLSLSSTGTDFPAQTDHAQKANRNTLAWDPARFAGEQISSLVRRVFFPGWPAPHNHVVFAAVEAEHDITGVLGRNSAGSLRVDHEHDAICPVAHRCGFS